MAVPSRPPEKGKIAGIDFGTVRIGVAICDAERIMAFPYEIYRRRNECNGDVSDKARQAIEFGNKLAEATGVSIDYVDERFTSREAESRLRDGNLKAKQRKAKLDAVAAQIILSTYLERGCVGTIEFLALDGEENSESGDARP